MNLILGVCILATLTSSLSALQCYSCEGKGNDDCVKNPTSVKIKTCSYDEQCYITRTEKSGSAVSIKRGCKSSVSASSSSSGGGFASSWSQSCSTDLCNSGDGTGFSFQMPDMSGFNIFKGFNGNNQQQQWQSSRNANAAPGNTNGAFLTACITIVAVIFNCLL